MALCAAGCGKHRRSGGMSVAVVLTIAILSGYAGANELLLEGMTQAEDHSHEDHDHNHNHDHNGHNHNHTNCGYNAAVKPWMQKSLKLFDAGREASQAMAKTQVQIASAGPSLEAEAPIRIHSEFQLSTMADYSKRYFLKYQLVPRMVAEIKRRILVRHPSTESLKVPRYCSMYYVRDDGGYNCAEVADQEYCSSPDVGIKHNQDFLDGYTVCTGTSDSSCTAQAGGPGVKDTDFVLYVAANDVSYCTEGHIVAFAGTCALDLDTNRPLAGFANFCPGNIDTNPENFQDLLETAVHEALHALFFSELLFPYFLDEYGQDRVDVIQYGSDGKKLLALPTVAKVVQEHFGCDGLQGAQLENEGGDGTAGNHWESSVFQGELMDGMSGAPNERAVFSAVTMAVIEDTGWYRANWEYQGSLGFGKGAGCDFLGHSCSTPGQEDSCSWDLKSVGKCSSELLLDGCSAPVSYKNMHCTQVSLFDERITPDSYLWGFGYGANSRCMKEKGPISKVPGDGYKYTKFAAESNLECYKFTCPNGKLHVVVGAHELPCPTGQDVDLTSIGYLSGKLGPCPDNLSLCDQLSCPNMCSGNGDCSSGHCHCNIGFAGADCSLPTCLPSSCPTGYTCNGGTGLCEAGTKAPELPAGCAGVVPSMGNGSDYGVVNYLMEMQAGGVGSLSDCYASTLPGGDATPPILLPGDSPSPAGAAGLPPAVPQAAVKNALPPTVPQAAQPPAGSPPASDAWLPVVDEQPAEVAPELNIGGDHAELSQPSDETAAPPSTDEEGPSTDGEGEGEGTGGVRVTVEVLQLDGVKPLSTLQAEALRSVLADSGGVSRDDVTFTDLILPSSPEKAYTLEVEAATASPQRVMTSLRNAESYGILESRLADEAKLQLVDVGLAEYAPGGGGGSSGGPGAWLAWLVLMVVLGAAAVACGAVAVWCLCLRPYSPSKQSASKTSLGLGKAAREAQRPEDDVKAKAVDPMSLRERRALQAFSNIVDSPDPSTATATRPPRPPPSSASTSSSTSASASSSSAPSKGGTVDERTSSSRRSSRASRYLVQDGDETAAKSTAADNEKDEIQTTHPAKPWQAPPVRPDRLVPPAGGSTSTAAGGRAADGRRDDGLGGTKGESTKKRTTPSSRSRSSSNNDRSARDAVPPGSVSRQWLDEAAEQPRRAADRQRRRRHHRHNGSQVVHPKATAQQGDSE